MCSIFVLEISTHKSWFNNSDIVSGLRILTGKKHPKVKLYSAYEKYEYGHLGHYYIKLTFLRGSKTEINLPIK